MSERVEYTHRITLPSITEIKPLFDLETKLFCWHFFCDKNPDMIFGYDRGLQAYLGFGLHVEERLLSYLAQETGNMPHGRVIMQSDPNNVRLSDLLRPKIDPEVKDVGLSFELTLPKDFDLKKFRRDLPDILELPVYYQPNILLNWSDLLITRLTPEGHSIQSVLPLAPRNAREGGLVPA